MRLPLWRALMLTALMVHPLSAEQYALLIGIGTYAAFPDFHLEGPSEDVPAVRAELIRTWHFPQRNVR